MIEQTNSMATVSAATTNDRGARPSARHDLLGAFGTVSLVIRNWEEFMFVRRVEPGPGQESVWDYPRPPRLEDCARTIKVVAGGEVLAESNRAKRVLETSHPPVYYIPPDDIRMDLLEGTQRQSFCEWKGAARYFDIVVGEQRIRDAAWAYPSPTRQFAPIRDHVAFYPHLMDACFVDGEQVDAQAGGFYGGWITSDIVGPFKGEPGTMGW